MKIFCEITLKIHVKPNKLPCVKIRLINRIKMYLLKFQTIIIFNDFKQNKNFISESNAITQYSRHAKGIKMHEFQDENYNF